MKKQLKLVLSTIATLSTTMLLAQSAHAMAFKPCTIGSACPLVEGETAMFTVTKETGTAFSCTVTADQESLSFTVKGAGQYIITEGAGDYVASPTVDVSISGNFKKDKPKSKGKIMFTDVVGGTGTVTCTAATIVK